eukprot:scaffold4399_cov175-Ochromonas_danica.AAC.20
MYNALDVTKRKPSPFIIQQQQHGLQRQQRLPVFTSPTITTTYLSSTTTTLDDNELSNTNRSSSESNLVLPTNRELFNFALPTLGIWLLQPILSLIDTTVVGMSHATTIAELAALGPGIGWVDSTSYLFNFLGIATTTLYSTALRDQDEKRSQSILANAVFLSFFFGLCLMLVQYFWARPAVSILAGASLASIPYAMAYAKIRAIAAPAALFTIIAQAAFLARKDSITPLYAVLVGALVNVVGDVFLVVYQKKGIVGAAWATTLSQYAGAIFLCAIAMLRMLKAKRQSPEKRMKIEMMIWPKRHESLQFLSFCGPMFFILLAKSFLWTFTTFAVGSAGAVDLAAHQSYLPYAFNEISEKTVRWGKTARSIVRQVTILGSILGVMNMGLSVLMNTVGTKFVTKSTVVAQAIRRLAIPLAACALPHCLMLGVEGALIAGRDVGFLVQSYVLSGLAFISYQLMMRSRALGSVGVWYGMICFQWVRLAMFASRLNKISSAKQEQTHMKSSNSENGGQ